MCFLLSAWAAVMAFLSGQFLSCSPGQGRWPSRISAKPPCVAGEQADTGPGRVTGRRIRAEVSVNPISSLEGPESELWVATSVFPFYKLIGGEGDHYFATVIY